MTCTAVNKIYAGTADFYRELDTPTWRWTDCAAAHTAYKVSVCGLFAIGTSVYVAYKSVTS